MLANLLGLAGPGLGVGHVVMTVLGTAFGAWLAYRPKSPAPTLADVVPDAHLGTIDKLLTAAESDPTVMAVVKLVAQRFEDMLTVEAHNALQSVAAPVAVPAAPVTVAAPAK